MSQQLFHSSLDRLLTPNELLADSPTFLPDAIMSSVVISVDNRLLVTGRVQVSEIHKTKIQTLQKQVVSKSLIMFLCCHLLDNEIM